VAKPLHERVAEEYEMQAAAEAQARMQVRMGPHGATWHAGLGLGHETRSTRWIGLGLRV
jgi:hypothetical protein